MDTSTADVDIKVVFNRPNSFYFAGEKITGKVLLQNPHEKLTVDELSLEFVGEIGYTTQETRHRRNSIGIDHTEHFSQTHHVSIITHHIPIVQPQPGQSVVALSRGQNSWPFEFVLPESLPPSSVSIRSTDSYPYVKYYMRIVLDKPWYTPNTNQVFPLKIFPRVNIDHLPSTQNFIPFSNLNRRRVSLHGHALQCGIVPGGTLGLDIDLDNPNRTEIKEMEAILIQHLKIAEDDHSEVIFRVEIPDLHNFHGEHYHKTLQLLIPPVHLSPTYTYTTQDCGLSINIDFYYELKVEIKSRGLFTDFTMSVPVVVGTVDIVDQKKIVNRFIDRSTPPVDSAYDSDGQPPSYESTGANKN